MRQIANTGPPRVPQVADLGSFTDDLATWRAGGADLYESLWNGESHSPMPGYFVDRYAFRAFLKERTGTELHDRFTTPMSSLARTWSDRLHKQLRPVGVAGIPALDVETVIPEYPGLADLLDTWQSHVNAVCAPSPHRAYASPSGLTWTALFQRSVLYPYFPPAIDSPSFLNRVTDEQRADILKRHGTDGVMGLYVALLFTHEESHRYQTGDSLACEIVFAALWCSYLDRHESWYWQRNAESGQSFNVEEPYLRAARLIDVLAPRALDDTAEVFASGGRYAEMCWAEWLMDAGALRYREYLEIALACLGGTMCSERLAEHHQRTVGTQGGSTP
jgi:hypothetical protein